MLGRLSKGHAHSPVDSILSGIEWYLPGLSDLGQQRTVWLTSGSQSQSPLFLEGCLSLVLVQPHPRAVPSQHWLHPSWGPWKGGHQEEVACLVTLTRCLLLSEYIRITLKTTTGLSEQYWKFAYDLKFWSSSSTSCLFFSTGITGVYHWVSLHSLKITWTSQCFLTFALNLCRVIIGWWSLEPPHTHTCHSHLDRLRIGDFRTDLRLLLPIFSLPVSRRDICW